jgi:hypothetical protein
VRRRIILVVAILAAVLFGVTGASAATTFTDPSGDAVAGAADITQLVVSNDLDGNITFALTFANRSTFTSDDTILIAIDADKNTSTGASGVEYLIGLTSSAVGLLRWDGTTFQLASSPTLRAANNNMTVTINRSDLGAIAGFGFIAISTLDSVEAAEDFAPENGGAYDLELTPVLDTLAARFAPAKPKAGKVFKLSTTILRLEDGTVVKADSITCVAKLDGKRLAGRCSWRMPKNAKGKLLVVTLTAHYKGATETFTPWRFRVGR